jgi:hypothetical protein
MDDFGRAAVLVIAIDEVLDDLRDRDNPALDEHIATLEDLRADTIARIEGTPSTLN